MGNVIGNRISRRRLRARIVAATWMSLGTTLGLYEAEAQMPIRLVAPQARSLESPEVVAKDQGRSFDNPRGASSKNGPSFAGQSPNRSGQPGQLNQPSRSRRVRRLPPVKHVSQNDQDSFSRNVSFHLDASPADSFAAVPSGGHSRVRSIEGQKQLRIAYRDMNRFALASAEASAWLALQAFADAADGLAAGGSTPVQRSVHPSGQASGQASNQQTFRSRVEAAKLAMSEARDFSPLMSADPELVAVRRRSHQTVLPAGVAAMSQSRLVDLYLDVARRQLVELASVSVDAAESMDVLASIILERDRPGSLAVATSLCFRRAALAGQPTNASLAYVLANQLNAAGLAEEAFGVRHYAERIAAPQSIDPALLADIPRVTAETVRFEQVDPAEFASISRDVLGGPRASTFPAAHRTNANTRAVSYRSGTTTKTGSKTTGSPGSNAGMDPSDRRPSAPSAIDATAVQVEPSRFSVLRNRLLSPLGGGNHDQ